MNNELAVLEQRPSVAAFDLQYIIIKKYHKSFIIPKREVQIVHNLQTRINIQNNSAKPDGCHK